MKSIKLGVLLFVVLQLISVQKTIGQIVVNSAVTGTQLAQTLVGAGVIISNITITCPSGGAGIFASTGTNLGMNAGIVLTSGGAAGVIGPNSSPSFTGAGTGPGDAALNAIISPLTTHDACILEFDAYVTSDTLVFNYVWGSEEYEEYVTGYNDVFALFIFGPGITGTQNIAIVPGTLSTPVSIFNVNCTANSSYYICNDSASSTYGGVCTTGCPALNSATTLEYDGFTRVLQAKEPVQRCNTYHLKLAVADAVDGALDSGIFIEANSLSSYGVKVTATPTVSNYPNAVENCINGTYCFERQKLFNDTLRIHFDISGSAINGVDYLSIPDSLVFYPGDTTLCINITPLEDNITEPLENVVIQIHYPNCGPGVKGDSIILFIQDKIKIIAMDTSICSQLGTLGVPVRVDVVGYVPPPQITCGNTTEASTMAPITQQIGNGMDTTADPSFLSGVYEDQRTLITFSAFDLVSAGYTQGSIKSLAFNIHNLNSTLPYQNFEIRIGCANDAAGTLPSVFPSGLLTAYSNPSYSPTLGWNTFNFTNSYDWDGVKGIFIELCFDNTASSNTDILEKTVTTNPSVMYAGSYAAVGCTLLYDFFSTTGTSNLRPNTKFTICPPPPSGFHFVWQPANLITAGINTASPTATITTNTTFTLTVDNIPGCPSTATKTIFLAPPYHINLLDSLHPCQSTSVPLFITADVPDVSYYKWYCSANTGLLSCEYCATPYLKADQSGWVYVNTANAINCKVNDSIWIRPEICPGIHVPSAFSPNGDGTNDYFFLLDRRFNQLLYFEIYNRWGEKVYASTDLTAKGWDGTYKGSKQDAGAFIYQISVIDKKGETETQKGNLTLIR
jgi:gliding motility-associated-like protein